jgi:hypothetical protein
MVGRALGGLSSAGGSVTLGMIADMWDSEHQQYAVAFVVFSSVGGSILGPIVGGFSETFLAWRFVYPSLLLLRNSQSSQVVDLDPTHLRRFRPDSPCLDGARDSHDHPDEPDCEETQKGRN